MTIPLIAVLGPTASGKSGLAEFLADQRGGELINADASALYRDLQVGVTKPDAETRRRHRYHLLDVADLGTSLTLVDYQKMAYRAIADVAARGRLPILVGGSNLYARAVLDGYCPPEIAVPESLRQEVRLLPLAAAVERLESVDPSFAARIDRKNPRRVARALELALANGAPVPEATLRPPEGIAVCRFLLLASKEVLADRIKRRTEAMWDAWREEVIVLGKNGLAHWLEVRKPIGYGAVAAHLQGGLTREEAVAQIVASTILLAKKQRTWLQKDTEGPDRHVYVLSAAESWDTLPQLALAQLDGFLARFTEVIGEK